MVTVCGEAATRGETPAQVNSVGELREAGDRLATANRRNPSEHQGHADPPGERVEIRASWLTSEGIGRGEVGGDLGTKTDKAFYPGSSVSARVPAVPEPGLEYFSG